jgi:peptidoglycan-N-acetylglucosamine deacetylase
MILAAASGALAATAGAALAWAVRGRSATVLAPGVWRVSTTERAVALTFDDGPSESTPALLDILKRHQAPATFFFCGANVRRLPEVARAVVEAGHEAGNHGDSHRPFYLRGAGFMRREMERAQRSIAEATGTAPVLFRVPFGARWFGLGGIQREMGLMGVMWSTLGLDWKRGGGQVCARLEAGLEPGAILCLHDGRELEARPDIAATIEAVDQFVPRARALGYRFLTISQLLCRTK